MVALGPLLLCGSRQGVPCTGTFACVGTGVRVQPAGKLSHVSGGAAPFSRGEAPPIIITPPAERSHLAGPAKMLHALSAVRWAAAHPAVPPPCSRYSLPATSSSSRPLPGSASAAVLQQQQRAAAHASALGRKSV